ncbi:MAG: RlmE family RNA methyltransferase [Myxococcales bacterium]|nr:RlmE family RNA methyltransferase [Myxococcales bacterium]
MGKPYRPKDHYFRKAKQAGLRARSAFKIEEIARRFALVKRGDRVLDLGAAPGGFLQVLSEMVGPEGLAIGVDLAPIQPLGKRQVRTAVLDVLAADFLGQLSKLHPGELDAVVSDLAPKTTGIRSTDEARSLELARRALTVARAKGRPGSSFVAKLFMGGDFEDFREEVRGAFEEVKVVRPRATRGGSFEVYVVGRGLRRR